MDTYAKTSIYSDRVYCHYTDLVNYIRSMHGSLQDAEDIVQETMMIAWENLLKYAGDAARPMLYRTAKNLYINRLKKQKRILYVSDYDDIDFHWENAKNMPPDGASIDIRRAVEKLPKKYSQILYLIYRQGLTMREISIITGIPYSTVAARRKRGLELICEDLGYDNIGSVPRSV